MSYPPYPMWYDTIPPYVPMDFNMYFMYYFGIKGPDLLIFGRREKYAANITQTKPVPHVEQVEQT
jgi:hypothetical protein